jgi:hypothetical protein
MTRSWLLISSVLALVTVCVVLWITPMGFFDKLFKKQIPRASSVPDHSVVLHFDYGSTDFARLFALQDELKRVIDAAHVGEFDGNEIAVSGCDGYFFMYGPDADELLAAIRPTLERTDFMKGARVKLRYGPPGDDAKELQIVLPK